MNQKVNKILWTFYIYTEIYSFLSHMWKCQKKLCTLTHTHIRTEIVFYLPSITYFYYLLSLSSLWNLSQLLAVGTDSYIHSGLIFSGLEIYTVLAVVCDLLWFIESKRFILYSLYKCRLYSYIEAHLNT